MILLPLFSGAALAQGFYFRAGLGYAAPLAGQSMYDTPIPYNGFPTGYSGTRNNVNGTQVYSIKSASFSSGMQGVLGFGYMVNGHVGVQLDGLLGIGPTRYTFNDNNVTLNLTGGGTLPGNISTTQKANTPFILIPSLVLQTGDTWKIYSRLGIALPLSTSLTQDQVVSNAPGTGIITYENYSWQIKSNFSLGFAAAAGLRYKLNDRASVWGEISMLSLSVFAKEQDLKSWTETQQGASQSYPVSAYGPGSTIRLGKTATVDTTLSNFPTYSIPFSHVGIQFGVTFTLSGNPDGPSSVRNRDEDIDPNKPFRRR